MGGVRARPEDAGGRGSSPQPYPRRLRDGRTGHRPGRTGGVPDLRGDRSRTHRSRGGGPDRRASHETLPREYKSVATTEAKILLIEAGPQVLASFAPRLQRYTQRRLQKMGVEVWLNTTAQDMDSGSV